MASFNSAFASALKSGKKTFSWNGKSYNTKIANGTPAGKLPKTPKAGPIPESRQLDKAPNVTTSAKAHVTTKAQHLMPISTTDSLKGRERAKSITQVIDDIKPKGPGVVRKKYKRTSW